MSRHRAVRNLDLDEELAEDDYYDEDPYGAHGLTYPSKTHAAIWSDSVSVVFFFLRIQITFHKRITMP